MRWKAPAAAFILLVASMVAASAPVEAPAGERSPCRPGEAFANDQVRIWFQGQKAHFKVRDNDGENASSYDLQTVALVELQDGEEVARMNLERAFPHGSTCTVEETEESVEMSITIADQVVRSAEGGEAGAAMVTYAFHFDKTSNGAKFDLLAADWPWQGSGMLAFDFSAHAEGVALETADNGLGFRRDDGSGFGFIEWAPTFDARYDDGSEQPGNVTSEVAHDGATAAVRLRFENAPAGYSELVYDPFMGVGDYLILLGRLVAVPGVAGVLPAGAKGLL